MGREEDGGEEEEEEFFLFFVRKWSWSYPLPSPPSSVPIPGACRRPCPLWPPDTPGSAPSSKGPVLKAAYLGGCWTSI